MRIYFEGHEDAKPCLLFLFLYLKSSLIRARAWVMAALAGSR
jgi:hypothetical protein